MMRMLDIEKELSERKALLRGHFQLSSGLHSDQYAQCARLFVDTDFAQSLGVALSSFAPAEADVVVSPALGGIIIGHEVARALSLPFFFAEREASGAMTLRRGFSLDAGVRILVVEDVFTTGKSTREVLDLLRSLGGRPVGALSVIDRGLAKDALGVPWASLVRLPLTSWKPEDCPLCKKGLPAVKPGSRPKP